MKTYLKAWPTTTFTTTVFPSEPCEHSSCDYECKRCDKKYGVCGGDGKCHCAERCFQCDKICENQSINNITGIKNFTEEYLKLIDNFINYFLLNLCIEYEG